MIKHLSRLIIQRSLGHPEKALTVCQAIGGIYLLMVTSLGLNILLLLLCWVIGILQFRIAL